MALGLAWLVGGAGSALRAGRVVLETPSRSHYAAWARLRDDSRDHLVPFEPQWSPDELQPAAFRRRLRRYRRDRRNATGYAFFVVRASDRLLLGGVTLSNVRRGVTQAASVGYWIGQPFVRQGFASEALSAVVQHAFEDLGLNRVEAACMPRNRASVGVLERAGFRREGLARGYLCINGAFEDHLLFGRLRHDAVPAVADSGGFVRPQPTPTWLSGRDLRPAVEGPAA